MRFVCPECNDFIALNKAKNVIDKVIVCPNCESSLFMTKLKNKEEYKLLTFRLGLNNSNEEDDDDDDDGSDDFTPEVFDGDVFK